MKYLWTFCFLAMMSTFEAQAEIQDCSKVLIKATLNSSSTEITNLSLAYQLTESAYNEARKDFGSGGSGEIYGIPVSGNLSYSDFRNEVKQRAESLKIDRFEFRSYAYATSGLDPGSLEAYKICLLKNSGMYLVAGQGGADSYVIWLVYFPPLNTDPNLKGRIISTQNVSSSSVAILKSEIANRPFNKRIDQQISITPTDRKSEAAVNIGAGDEALTLILPPLLRVATPNRITSSGTYTMVWRFPDDGAPWKDIGSGKENLAIGDIIIGTPCLRAQPGWRLSRNTVRIAPLQTHGKVNCGWVVCPEADRNDTKFPSTAAECRGSPIEDSVCFSLRMSFNQGDGGGICQYKWDMTGDQQQNFMLNSAKH